MSPSSSESNQIKRSRAQGFLKNESSPHSTYFQKRADNRSTSFTTKVSNRAQRTIQITAKCFNNLRWKIKIASLWISLNFFNQRKG